MRIWFFFNLHVSKGYSTRRLLTELTEFPDKGSRESARRVHLLGNQAAVWINARICTGCHHTSLLLRATFHVFPVGYLTFKLILNIYALLCSDVSVANHTPRYAHKIHGRKPVSSTKLHQSLWANSVYQTMGRDREQRHPGSWRDNRIQLEAGSRDHTLPNSWAQKHVPQTAETPDRSRQVVTHPDLQSPEIKQMFSLSLTLINPMSPNEIDLVSLSTGTAAMHLMWPEISWEHLRYEKRPSKVSK